jgi:hypothetical protein
MKLINLVFDSGFFPECWTVGIIKPLYTNKGDPTNPENYRPITLLSCMGKVFTAILNRRLCIISEEYDILSKNQCCFRREHSTLAVRKLFVVVLLISSRHLILFGELVFGKKLLDNCIDRKCFRIIRNMYSKIKSYITQGNEFSLFF